MATMPPANATINRTIGTHTAPVFADASIANKQLPPPARNAMSPMTLATFERNQLKRFIYCYPPGEYTEQLHACARSPRHGNLVKGGI